MKHRNRVASKCGRILLSGVALWWGVNFVGVALAQGAAPDMRQPTAVTSQARRDLGRQLPPETRARIRDQVLDERQQRLERQAERRGSGEGAARQLNPQERQQLREQVNEAHRHRSETPTHLNSARKPHPPQAHGR